MGVHYELSSIFFHLLLYSSILQTVPNILISYYAFPSRTLIHIGFFQVSFVCLVVAFGGLVFLVEKFGWLIHIKVHGKIPDELYSAALIIQHINLQKSSPTGIPPPESAVNQTTGSPRVGQTLDQQHEARGNIQGSPSALQSSSNGETVPTTNRTNTSNTAAVGGASLITGSETSQQPAEAQQMSETQFEEVEYSNKAELKHLKDLFIVFLQILTALLLAVALYFLIIVIGIIVFTDTVDKDNVQGILTLLPTIVVDVVIIVTRKRFFDSKEALRYQLARVMEASPETLNERTPLIRRQSYMQQ